MPAQLISYDLITPGKDYASLHNGIKALGSWWHCLESTWIVDTTANAASIRDQLADYIDANDKLLVVGLDGNWATQHLGANCNDWLRTHL
jgi:hypothetical protein